MSFTDEQLLNLVNNTILTKSEFLLEDFTGGGVQTTSTHNHKIIKHKIYLTFGYDDKRNPRSYHEDIDEEISFIWHKAILVKVKSLQALKNGSVISDLNILMSTKIEIEDRDNKIEDRDKECNEFVTKTIRKKKTPTSSLQLQIEQKLSEYTNINLVAFNEWVTHKKYKSISPITKLLNMFSKYNMQSQQDMVDKSIMNNWVGLVEPKQNMSHQKSNYTPIDGVTASQMIDIMAEQEERKLLNENTIN